MSKVIDDVLIKEQEKQLDKIAVVINQCLDVDMNGKRSEISGNSSFTPKQGKKYNVVSVVPQIYRLRDCRIFRGSDVILYSTTMPETAIEVPKALKEEADKKAVEGKYPVFIVKNGGDFGISFVANVVDSEDAAKIQKKISIARLFGRNCINKVDGKEIEEEPALEWFTGKSFLVGNAFINDFMRNDGGTYEMWVFTNIWE